MQKQAFVNGRRITAEINIRLKESLKQNETTAPQTYAPAIAKPPLTTDGKPPPAQAQFQPHNAKGPANLSETDQAMLDIFRRMPAQKQLALLSLFDN